MGKKLIASRSLSPVVHKQIIGILTFTPGMHLDYFRNSLYKLEKTMCKLGIVAGAATFCPLSTINGVRATSHSTIFDIPMRPLREDQKHRHRITR